MMKRCLLCLFVYFYVAAGTNWPSLADDNALDRFALERLRAVHEAVVRLASQRREVPRGGELGEYRANLHVHSAFSHDSRGTIEEIVAAAKKAGTKVLMFTEHPADHYDFYLDGHRGMRDGVLLVPGAETKGMLVYPRESLRGLDSAPVQQFSDLVRGQDGLTFLSHLEERMDWEIQGISGVEIYNTHADFKDERRLLSQFRNPLWILSAAARIREYPQEAFSALHNYPADYLRRWDQLCAESPHTGVSANDAHQNVGLVIRLTEDNKARVEDPLGEKLLEVDAAALTALLPANNRAAKTDGVIFKLQLDPYENSLRHVGTHLLMPELTEAAVWQALQSGRAFVAFDWIADATGFDLAAETDGKRYEMGSQFGWRADLRLAGRAPLAGKWKLYRNGQLHFESVGETFQAAIKESGRYRAELWLDVAGEDYVWVLSNPFYVTDQ
jgi:hypothetical protein